MTHQWMDAAACRDADPEAFWPEPARSAAPALAICRRCTVIDACFAYVMAETVEPGGVWGGTTESTRRRMRVRSHDLAGAKR